MGVWREREDVKGNRVGEDKIETKKMEVCWRKKNYEKIMNLKYNFM
jgi:hypothetical protein